MSIQTDIQKAAFPPLSCTNMQYTTMDNLPKQIKEHPFREGGCFTFVENVNKYFIIRMNKNNINLNFSDVQEYINYINGWFKKYFAIENIIQIKENSCKVPERYTTKIKNLNHSLIFNFLIKSEIIRTPFEKESFEFTKEAENYYGVTNATVAKSCKITEIYSYPGGIASVAITITAVHPGYTQHLNYHTTIRNDVLRHKETGKSPIDFFFTKKEVHDFLEEYKDQTLVKSKLLYPYNTDTIILDYTKTNEKNLIMNSYNKRRLRLLLLTIIRPLLTTKYQDIPIKLIHLKQIFPSEDLFYLYGLINFSKVYHNYYWLSPSPNQIFPTDLELSEQLKRRKSSSDNQGSLHEFFTKSIDPSFLNINRSKQISNIQQDLAKVYNPIKPGNIILTKEMKSLWKQLNKVYIMASKCSTTFLQAVETTNTSFITKNKIYTACSSHQSIDLVQIVADDYIRRNYNKSRFKIVTQNKT